VAGECVLLLKGVSNKGSVLWLRACEVCTCARFVRLLHKHIPGFAELFQVLHD
jgi:hypothetical protein